jgi:hypothetical protein
VKAALVIVAVLAMLGRMHATAGEVAVAVLAAELAVAAVLGFLIARAGRRRPFMYWTTTGGSNV